MGGKDSLRGRTVFITGASRGIGLAIALRCAKDGANIVIAAKTAKPDPRLPGTIYTAASEIEAAGGKCLPCICDIRFEDQVQAAVDAAVKRFGGIDILVNNASAIHLADTEGTSMKRYDLMNNINTRGTYMVSKLCLPHLQRGHNPHILNISPPLDMDPQWFKPHTAYTIAKYGMTMCMLGMSAELQDQGIAVNSLWPRSTIYTAAVYNLSGHGMRDFSRKPDIMADAAYAILTRNASTNTGRAWLDEEVLMEEGLPDLKQYTYNSDEQLHTDIFVTEERAQGLDRGWAAKAKL